MPSAAVHLLQVPQEGACLNHVALCGCALVACLPVLAWHLPAAPMTFGSRLARCHVASLACHGVTDALVCAIVCATSGRSAHQQRSMRGLHDIIWSGRCSRLAADCHHACAGCSCPARKDVASYLLELTTVAGQAAYAGPQLLEAAEQQRCALAAGGAAQLLLGLEAIQQAYWQAEPAGQAMAR